MTHNQDLNDGAEPYHFQHLIKVWYMRLLIVFLKLNLKVVVSISGSLISRYMSSDS